MKETTNCIKNIFKGKVFEVHKDEVTLENGTITNREVVKHNGGVCIYGEIDGMILMVKQYRYPFKREFVELPAGKLEVGENPYDAAVREFREETGYLAGSLNELGSFIPTCAYNTERIYFYQAIDLKYIGMDLDENEFLDVVKINKDKVKEMILDGTIQDGKTMALCLKIWSK